MNEDQYIVISRCEDDVRYETLPGKALKKLLLEDWAGYDFINSLRTNDIGGEFPPKSLLIIKGGVVIPTPKKTVTEYDL